MGQQGYALNPARDLGPRIMHSILPIPNKGDGDWSYAWIPVVGPVIGAALAVLVFSVFKILKLNYPYLNKHNLQKTTKIESFLTSFWSF